MSTAWVSLNQDKYPGVSVEVQEIGGRVTIVGVRVLNPEGVTLEDLQSVPLSRLEAEWNNPESENARLIRARLRASARKIKLGQDPTPKAPTRGQMRLAIPEHRPYPDAFFVAVAMLYHQLVANGIRPGPALAEANDVPLRTVQGWFVEARRREILAPARKGRAG